MAVTKSSLPVAFSVPVQRGRRRAARWRRLAGPASLVGALLIWEAVARLSGLPAFILPPPTRVGERLLLVLADGTLGRHALVTLFEVLAGLGSGLIVAAVLGYIIAKSPALERAAPCP